MTAVKAPSAPTTSEQSDLPCTHIRCEFCDSVDERPDDVAGWSCPWCTSLFNDQGTPVFEHHSPKPLGYRDDKAHWWPALRVDAPEPGSSGWFVPHPRQPQAILTPPRAIDWPERWVYPAKEPA